MKRFLVLCIAVVACYAAVTGSIAYFTDSVETTNRVASGNLHVVQHEYERVKDANGYTDKLKAFTQEKPLYPAVVAESKSMDVAVNGHAVKLENGIRNYVDKIVTAENKGSLNMFVRTYIAVPSFAEGVATEPWITLDVNEQKYGTANDCWTSLGDAFLDHVSIDGHYYDIYKTTYSGLIEPNGITPPSLLGFYMDSHVTNDGDGLVFDKNNVHYDLGNGSNMKILVATVASQATVFEGTQDKSRAMVAMDSTYTDPNYHPWSNTHFVENQTDLDAVTKNAATPYDTVVSLSDGAYTLPATLPAGLRITGAGAVVMIDVTTLSANDVEFDHVTFIKPVTFTGWGSFEEVTFEEKLTATCTHDTVFVDCKFEKDKAVSGSNVSFVESVPATTK